MKIHRYSNPFISSGFVVLAGIMVIPTGLRAASNTWTGAVDSNWDSNTANWTSPTVWTAADDAVFGAGVGTVNVTDNITANSISAPGAGTLLYIGTGNTLRISRASASAPPWSKIAGAGTLSLNTAASGDSGWGQAALPAGFTGTLQIEKGRVSGNPSNLGAATGLTIGNGAQFLAFDGTTGSYTFPQALSISGLGHGESGHTLGALRVSTMNATFTGGVTLTGNTGLYTQSGNMILSGAISDGGSPYTLAINTAGGSITLNGATSNTYTGLTTMSSTGYFILSKTGGSKAMGGDITLASTGNYGVLVTTQDNQFASGAVFRVTGAGQARFELKGTTQTLGGLDSTGYTGGFAAIQHSEFGAATPVDGVSTLIVDVAGANSFSFGNAANLVALRDYNGGSMQLVKNGTGTQTLIGSNMVHTGTTTVNNGTLVLQNTTSFGSVTTVNTNGTLNLVNTTTGFGGRATISRNISGTGTINVNNSGTGVAGGWVKLNSGGGNLVSFTGTVNVNSGVLSMDNLNATFSGNPTLHVVSGGVFGIRGQNISIDALSGDGDIMNDWSGDPGGHTLTIGANGGSGTFSGVIHGNNTSGTDGALEAGTLHLTKTGGGTLTLAGANTYSGATTVNGGILIVNGSLANTAVSVNNTATLAGNGTLAGGVSVASGGALTSAGTISGSVTVASGGTLSPAGPGANGTLTANGSLSLAGATVIDINKSGSTITGDQIGGTGHITFGGSLTVVATGDTLALGDSYQIFVPGGTYDGAFASFTLPTLTDPALSWDTSTLPTDGKITVVNHVGTPNFNPAAGAYVLAQSVSITSDSGSTIYYTTDNSTPTTSSPSGTSGAFAVTVPVSSTNFTIKAFAHKAGQADSPVATAIYNTIPVGVWNIDNDGNWSEAAKWLSNAIPNGSGAPVDFSVITQSGPAKVTLDSSRIVGSMTFGNDIYGWTLDSSGGSILTLDGGTHAITVLDNTTTISASIAGTQGLVKAGPGTLVLSASNSYTGTTEIDGSVLSTGTLAPNGSNSGIGAGTDITLDGGTLRYTGGNNGNDTLSTEFNRNINLGTGGGTIDIAGSGFVFCNGSISGSSTLTVVDTSGDANNKQVLLTSNSPSFTGDIHIGNGATNSGWVQVRSNAASPLGSGTVTVNTGGVLSSDTGATAPLTVGNNIILNGGTLGSHSNYTQFSGNVTVNASMTSYFTTNLTGLNNLVITGSIVGSGTLEKNGGNSSAELRGDNSGFTGTYNDTYGATIFYAANSASAAASWSIPAGSNTGARFLAAASSATYRLGALSGTTGYMANLNNSSGNSIFEIGALNVSTEFDGVIRDTDGTVGTVGITKVGSTGTLTLGGTNTYTGPTTVSQGTLALSATGSISNTPLIDIKAGATLDVSAVSGGIAPLGAAQTITGNGAVTGTVAVFGTYSAHVDSSGTPSAEKITVSGAVALQTGALLQLNDLAAVPVSLPGGTTLTILSCGTLTGTFAGLNEGATITAGPNTFVIHYHPTSVTLVKGGNYASWASTHGITGEASSLDHDNDGLNNGVEYALGLDPTQPDGSPGTLTAGVLSFTKGADAIANGDVTYVIEESDDLGLTDPWAAVVTQTPPNASATIFHTLPTGKPMVFSRLKISIQ